MNSATDLTALRGDPVAQRQLIDAVMRAALDAVDPREAVFRRVKRMGGRLLIGDRAIDLRVAARVFLVAIGKAAAPMADALLDLLDDALTAGVLVTKRGHAGGFDAPSGLRVVEAGHPVPDAQSVAAVRAIETLLMDATSRDVLLCAVSGGGSALVTLPVAGVSLDDLQITTDLLLRSGATIHELNAVRKHLDRIKGGGLARMSRGADTVALLLSDVIGDDLSVIASGPTAPDPSTFAEAWQAIARFELAERLPGPVRAHLEAGRRGEVDDTPKPGDPLFARVTNLIVGSNRTAAEAADAHLRSLGFNTLLLSTFVQGEAREVGTVAAAIAREIAASGKPIARPACVVAGGETTVTVRGGGQGGRNQELALSSARGIEGLADTWVVALATDGGDGTTDAAGAAVDGGTMSRARAAGLDAAQYLADNDSHRFFAELAGLIQTGPTGTNVNDLLFVFVF